MIDDIPTSQCGLCHEFHPLRQSHLLPAALYRYVRLSGQINPNPVLATAKMHKTTSAQIRQYLLCHECENRFNRNGERWVLNNCFRGKGHYQLHASLTSHRPIFVGSDFQFFEARSIPEIDVSCLAYFATSVFWRASVRPWKVNGDTTQIHLGPYEEQIRLYLLGATSFPSDGAIWVTMDSSPSPVLAFCTPYTERRERFHQHRFAIPGILFHLFLGKRIDPKIRFLCLLRSPGNFISMGEKVGENTVSLLRDVISRSHLHQARRSSRIDL
jgi:uncharacterized CHY-type Zn-finger protein